ncbi:hypothetical protein [Methanopyrus sp.]
MDPNRGADADLRRVVEALGFFFDPVRAVGLALNLRGHMCFIDGPGAGKTAFLDTFSVALVTGEGVTREVMVWDERTGRPGVVLFYPAGFVGWDECDSIRSPELRSLVLELLDFRVDVWMYGEPRTVKHDCRFLFAGRAVPAFPERDLIRFLGRMQYIGGVGGDIRDRVHAIDPRVVEVLYERILRDVQAVHLAGCAAEGSFLSSGLAREILGRYLRELREAFAAAFLETAKRFPTGADAGIARRVAISYVQDKVNRFADTVTAFGGPEVVADVVREYYALCDLETPEDDVECLVHAWVNALMNNYSQWCSEGGIPGPKVAYGAIVSEDDLDLKFEDVVG